MNLWLYELTEKFPPHSLSRSDIGFKVFREFHLLEDPKNSVFVKLEVKKSTIKNGMPILLVIKRGDVRGEKHCEPLNRGKFNLMSVKENSVH